MLHSKSNSLSVAAIAAALILSASVAEAATLTLVNASALAQVAASNRPLPQDVRVVDSLRANVVEPGLGGDSLADVLLGETRFRTTASDATGSGSFATTNTASLSYLFRNDSTAPIILPTGALTFTVDADFSRSFAVPRVNDQPVVAQTNFVTGLTVNRGLPASANARVEVVEVSDGRLTVTPDGAATNFGLSIPRQDATGLDSVFSSPALTFNPGELFGFTASITGNAARVGPFGFASLGVTATVDAANTGRLNLVLPQDVEIGGLAPGQSLAWVAAASNPPSAVPLPASGALLLGALAGLGALTRRRRILGQRGPGSA